MWGSGSEGQLGLGVAECEQPSLLKFRSKVTFVACGYYHTAVITGKYHLSIVTIHVFFLDSVSYAQQTHIFMVVVFKANVKLRKA